MCRLTPGESAPLSLQLGVSPRRSAIGGPPCQSWSNAGKGRGFDDPRGKVFLTFINILREKHPLFFVAENVKGIMAARNMDSFHKIEQSFKDAGYNIWVKCLNANDYNVPQNRERVFFVGFRSDLDVDYHFPSPILNKPCVSDAIKDLQDSAVSMGNVPNINAHEYWVGGGLIFLCQGTECLIGIRQAIQSKHQDVKRLFIQWLLKWKR